MHVPDGFLDASTSLATGAIALGGVGLSLTRADAEIRRTGPALAGLTAAFVFAVQMVNFPVGAGTSGHLLGGVLAAALVGPWTAVVCLSAVLLVQGLVFADGGLTALGTNVTLMGVVTVLVGYAVTRLVLRVMPKRPASVVPAAAIGALVSVPSSAAVFVLLYAIGGAVGIPLGALAAAMVGWHTVIGVGEAVITAAVLSAVIASRPDLVYVARRMRPDLVVIGPDGTRRTVRADAVPQGLVERPRTTPVVVGGLMTLIVAGVVSLAASSNPDGLEYVSGQLGFEEAAATSAAAVSPFADYATRGLSGPLATSAAGVVGVLVTLLLVAALTGWVRRRASAHQTRIDGLLVAEDGRRHPLDASR